MFHKDFTRGKMLLDNKLLKELLSEILEESPDGEQQHIKWEVKEDPNTIKAEESTDVISKESSSKTFKEGSTCCNTCAFKASSQSTLKVHIEMKHKDIKWEVKEEPNTIKDGESKDFIPKESSSKTYAEGNTCCNTCGFKASSYLTLKVHIEMKHLNLWFFCGFCQYKTKEKYIMKKHVRVNHPDKNFLDCEYRCDPCQIQQPLKVFKEHFLDFHPDLKYFYNSGRVNFCKNAANGKNKSNCTFCSFKTKTFSLLNTHMIYSHLDILYQCKICDKEIRNLVAIRHHIIQKHIGKIDKKIYAGKRLKLSTEQRRFVWDNLLRHCLICQRKIVKGEDIENHILVNHTDKHEKKKKRRTKRRKSSNLEFKCQECNYSSNMKGNLIIHVKSQHLKVKYICKKCSFETGNLQTHQKSHNQIDTKLKVPFESKCPPCSFTTENHLEFDEHVKERHLSYLKFQRRRAKKTERVKNSESRNLPHKCNECKYASRMKGQLKTHITDKHMKAKFTCSNCRL